MISSIQADKLSFGAVYFSKAIWFSVSHKGEFEQRQEYLLSDGFDLE